MTADLVSTIGRACADIERPISSVTIAVPTGAAAAVLSISVAAMRCGGDNVAPGVSVSWCERLPNHVEALPTAPDDMSILRAAWQSGAWDVARHCYGPGYAGPMPPSLETIHDQMRAHGWTSWSWRPMMMAPEIRQRAHAHRDLTLVPLMLGRAGEPPEIKVPPALPGTMRVIRLGIDPAAKSRPGPRATGKQRAYIVALRRGTAEEGQPLPASLSRSAASAMIDRLISTRPRDG